MAKVECPSTFCRVCDDFRPRYAVDIEVLTADGEPDPDLPVLAGVPLPLPNGGDEMGMFGFPEEGTRVVVCFAYCLPNSPYIQSILPHRLSLSKVPKGDQVWQHSDAVQQRVDEDGKIRDEAIEREVKALGNSEQFQSHKLNVDDHSTEMVEGIKKIDAMGALKLLSGGSVSLSAVDDLHQATCRDLNLVVGQTLNATVGGDLQERIQGLRRSIAPKTWLGSEAVNVLQVLCDLIEVVQHMNIQIAAPCSCLQSAA